MAEMAISDRLKDLQCPFTWGLDKIEEVIKDHEEPKAHDDEKFVPLLKWMRLLVEGYECVIKNNLTEAKECISSAEKVWDSVKVKHSAHISLEVLENICTATKCYVEWEEGHLDETKKILDNIKDINYKTNAKVRSTLNGCKSVAWSTYKDAGNSGYNNAIYFANLAIQDNRDFDAWHFILGKNLRRKRRVANFLSIPSNAEAQAFEKAYALSKEPIYGTFLAQMYKEKRNKQKALEIYKTIYNSKPESCSIRSRLALGFIRQREFLLAKECLDYVEERFPEDCMFLHYKGIYLDVTGNHREAAEYYLKASKHKNFAAEICYLKCKAKLNIKYNFVQHLQEMLKTYSTYEGRELDILLQLAVCCYLCNHDIPSAAKYYLQAFEKYPDSIVYKNHECILGGRTDIYNFLQTDFLKQACARSDLDADTKRICQKLKDRCSKKNRFERKTMELKFDNIKLS